MADSGTERPGAQRAEEREAHEDELLAIRCQLGEAAAFDALIERWHAPLWSYIRRMSDSDDEAGDVLQDTWLRVLRALPRLREPASVRAWLFGIARRTLMDRLRGRYATPPHDSIDDVTNLGHSDDDSDDDMRENVQMMLGQLARLPVVEREVLVLFYLQQLSLAQVAGVLDVPVGTVKSRLHRARRMLRGRINEEEDGSWTI